jgi:anthranilate phosphoribosyltransferase
MPHYSLENWPLWLDDFLAQALPEPLWQELLASLTPEKTSSELAFALWQRLREQAIAFPACDLSLMDCCGTGGSGQAHYNTSTTVAFILAAGGLPVAKFGNRAISSRSGSFDFLEAIGVCPASTPEAAIEQLHKTGLTFLLAPQVYPGLASFQAARKQCPHPTIFNLLGPLLHPLNPAFRLMGVAQGWPLEAISFILKSPEAQTQRALMLQSDSGLDELEPDFNATGLLLERSNSNKQHVKTSFWSLPKQVDGFLQKDTRSAFAAKENAAFFQALLAKQVDKKHELYQQICLNAGLAFSLYGKVENLTQGYKLAERLLEENEVKKKWKTMMLQSKF